MTRTSIMPDMQLQRNENAISVDIDGETVMMDMDKGSYFALTGSGGYIWQALEHPATLGEISRQVQAEFDTSGFDSVEDAVAKLVEDLLENGLVTCAG